TQAGQMVGTPAYMAPECFDGTTDVRSEVFALGVVLYELLVGRRPFDRDSAFATMAAIQLDEPEPPSRAAVGRGVPPRVDRVVARALAKAPAERFADMRAMAAALRAAARPVPWRPWAAAGGAAALAAGVATIWMLRAPPRAAPPLPLEVTTSRRLTLDPGCEEYPRFTPAGDAVILDALIAGDYDVVRVPLDGGPRQRLTDEPGWDYAAAISPDGAHLAYVHEGPEGRTLRVRDLAAGDAAAPRDLGPLSGYPAWSPDGRLLVGDDRGRVLAWRPGAPGVDEVVLGQLPAGARAYHVAPVGDLGVAVLWWTHGEGVASGLGELARDGTLRVIEEASTDYEGGMAPSPSGRGYYVTRKGATTGNQLMWRPWGGGEPRVVPGGLSPRAGLDVARDGTRLVFSTCTDRQYVARLREGEAPVASGRGEWHDTSPVALGGKRLFLRSDRLGAQQGWVVDGGGDEPRPVTPPDSHGALPSPDGRHVVYVADGGRGGIAIAPLDGGADPGAARRVTADPSDRAPVVTGDGAQVV
ncbi:MAG: PD40 domain-containing protein, partial [Kofleriaceae bacterium]|nr:PD40 domain-containing protein [Kofleriaceae bacterium]